MARVALLLLLVRALSAQSVEGAVTDRVRGVPLPDLTVTVIGPTVVNAITDATGIFRSGLLQPGKYRLAIAISGYEQPSSARSYFDVADTAVRRNIELEPLCRVVGRILYPDGTPAINAAVTLQAYPSGRAFQGTADLTGRFAFEEVAPGAYLLRASAAAKAPAPEGESWIPVSEPEPIRLRAGASVARDLRLRSGPTLHIRGIVRDEFARPAAGVAVNSVKTGADGTFDLPAYAGDWRLNANATGRRGFTTVTLTRHDVENVEIRLARPLTVSVNSSLMLEAVEAYGSAVAMDNLARGVSPGRYLILPPPVAGSYVDSIKLDEIEVIGQPVGIWDSSAVIRVHYEKGSATVRGTVEQGGGASVTLYAIDTTALRLDGMHTATAAADGQFEIANLRPGDYWAVALDCDPPLTLADPALQALAVRVHVGKGETATTKLTVADWR